MKSSKYFFVGLLTVMILGSTAFTSMIGDLQAHSSVYAQSTPSVGIFIPDNTFKPGWGSSMMQSFYNTVFGQGVFSSMEMFTPLGISYSNSITDTTYTQQIIQIAKSAEQNHFPIKVILIVGMDLKAAYNESSHEWTQLVNFVNSVKPYPEVYALGVNWERDTWGCDAFSCSMRYATAQELSQAAVNIQNLVQGAGKQFISYYTPPISGVAPPSGRWSNIGNAGFPLGNNDPRFPTGYSVGYWTVGWFVKPTSVFNYVGLSAGLFVSRTMPDPVYYADLSGDPVSSCTLTTYSGPCGPGGQWNPTTVNWFFEQEKTLYSLYPSARQFIMLGGAGISNSATLIDGSLPAMFWNSQIFQSWVKQGEQTFGMTQVITSSILLTTSSTTSLDPPSTTSGAQATLSSTNLVVGSWAKISCSGFPSSSALQVIITNTIKNEVVAYLFPGSTTSSGTCTITFLVTSSMIGSDSVSIYSGTSELIGGLLFNVS